MPSSDEIETVVIPRSSARPRSAEMPVDVVEVLVSGLVTTVPETSR
jgi:hypothetical protein